jgi:hypothetical protein
MRVLALFLVLAAPMVLRPGAGELVTDHLGTGAQTVRIMNADSEIGRFRYEWQTQPNDRMRLVTSGQVRSKTFVDTLLYKRHGLTPISEVSEFGGKVKRWTYDGSVFNFQELDDLLCSLPFTQGYQRILPLFSEGDDSTEMDTVRVLRRNAAGRRELRFADPAIVATYEIDERTRRIVRHEYVLRKSGTVMRYLSDTPDTSTSSAPPG